MFVPHDVTFSEANRPTDAYVADIDNDGDLDILSTSFYDDQIAWYTNVDGRGTFQQHVISQSATGARAVMAADIDGDLDLDVLVAKFWENEIVWYENTDGLGSFGPSQTITQAAGLPDSVFVADIDGDDDLDVISTGWSGNVIWFENTNGQGVFAQGQAIDSNADAGLSIVADDIDSDGDADVVALFKGGRVAWYENIDSVGTFAAPQVLSTQADAVNSASVSTGDIDADGDVDVLTGAAWFENDGTGSFGVAQQVNGGGKQSRLADIDGDGAVDVVSATGEFLSSSNISWFANTNRTGEFTTMPTQVTTDASNVYAVRLGDVDGDGDVDVVSASYSDDKIAWYENIDSQGTFGDQQVITKVSQANNARSVGAGDIDGDGDQDMLSLSADDRKFAWYENIDGRGMFGEQRVISTDASTSTSGAPIIVFDVDRDGDNDVLYVFNGVYWHDNLDGSGTFGQKQLIPNSSAVSAVSDFDGNGQIDFVLSEGADSLVLMNVAVDGIAASTALAIDSDAPNINQVFATDWDSDGDIDVVASTDSQTFWYENVDGQTSFRAREKIADHPAGFAGDVDGDGLIDLIFTLATNNNIVWYQNSVDANPQWSSQIVSQDVDRPSWISAADIDGDNDLDILSASFGDDAITWYENRIIGDVNNDGVFDSADLVAVFQAAEYEDNILGNSTYNEGDWNGDKEFDSSDLVFAFQAATYVSAAHPTAFCQFEIAAALDTKTGPSLTCLED